MAHVFIPVTGGLVTSRDRSLLRPGELTRADNAEYKPGDPGVWKVPGRTAYNAAEAAAIKGVSYLEHEGTDDRVAIVANGEIKVGTFTALTGSFSSLPKSNGLDAEDATTAITTPTTADFVHYNDKYYYLDGVNGPYQIGLQSNLRTGVNQADTYNARNTTLVAPPAPTVVADSGGFTLTSGSTIEVWVTEATAAADGTAIQHSPASDRTTITGDGSAIHLDVTLAAGFTNPQCNRRFVWVSGTNVSYPLGFLAFESNSAGVVNGTITAGGTDPGGATLGSSAYPIVTVSISGTELNYPKWLNAPLPTTGDIFEDSLVVNDVNNKTLVYFSFPDDPTAFPTPNFIRFETREADEVACIRSLNNRVLIVCLRNSLWAVHYLPRPEDAEFDRGRAKSLISSSHGCVGPLAAAVFSYGEGQRMAVVSSYGIIGTDGTNWAPIADDIDWEGTVNVASLSSAVLINNPKRWRLEFYYTPAGGVANTKCLYLHYHPSHVKGSPGQTGFSLKVTGPVDAVVADATVATLSSAYHVLTANSDGIVYVEGNGTTDASGAGSGSMVVHTGELHGSGMGGSAMANRVLMHTSGASGQVATAYMSVIDSQQNDSEYRREVSLARRGLNDMDMRADGNAHIFGAEAASGGPWRLNGFVAVGEDTTDTREG